MMDYKENDRMFTLTSSMPDEQSELLKIAYKSINKLHNSVLNEDKKGIMDAIAQYDAVIWKMNGGTLAGCYSDVNSPGNIVENYCRADIGTIPKWGQKGSFVMIVDNIRILIEFGGIGSQETIQFSFYAVDLDYLFISDTGYSSYFGDLWLWYGSTVDEAAKSILLGYLKNKRYEIKLSARDLLAKYPLPPVLTLLEPPARRSPIDIPPGYVIIDVILPAQKAFIVRKWANEALETIKTKMKEVKK